MNSTHPRAACAIALALLAMGACSKNQSTPAAAPCFTGTQGTGSSAAQVSWTANREAAVNAPGGGYTIYYCSYSGFDVSLAKSMSVPYVSGVTAPTTAKLSGIASGVYYLKVVAFSAMNAPGNSNGSQSAGSSEATVTVP